MINLKFFFLKIYCFQEMDHSVYKDFFEPNLTQRGYECHYKKRTGNKCDGCAIVFNKKKFKLIQKQPVDYCIPGIPLLDR
jgi:protein angel